MFKDILIWKSGKEIKEASLARLNREEQEPSLPDSVVAQLQILSRNPKDEDRIQLTVEQLIVLGL